jgi:hypothetical protein
MRRLEVFQSLWAMERRAPDGTEWSLPEKFKMIAEAGYDGLSIDMAARDIPTVEEARPLFREFALAGLVVAFPHEVEDLKPVYEMAAELGVRFVAINAVTFPFRPEDGAAFVSAALDLARAMGVEAHFETHRYTLTTDMLYTVQVMDLVPEMELVCDLSHFVVAREFTLPPDGFHAAQINRVLERCVGLQGRIATREQVQIQPAFERHKPWVDQFWAWWEQGLRNWRARKGPDGVMNFLCELGPPPYAITGADGWELSDRWAEAQLMKDGTSYPEFMDDLDVLAPGARMGEPRT